LNAFQFVVLVQDIMAFLSNTMFHIAQPGNTKWWTHEL